MMDKAFLRGYVTDLAIAERAMMPELLRVISKMRAHILREVEKHSAFGSVPQYALVYTDLKRVIADGMIYAHLLGDKRVRAQSRKATRGRAREVSLDLTAKIKGTFKEANQATIEYLRNLYDSKAFDIAQGLSEYADIRLRETIADAIKEGKHLKGIMDDLRATFDDLGLTDVSKRSIETIARTQTQLAFNAGKWNAEQDPDIAEVLWGYTYTTVGDDRVRPEHELLDNVTLPKEDSFWRANYPPNGWNCRCQVIPLFDKERSIKAPAEYLGPDKDFNFNPGEAFRSIV